MNENPIIPSAEAVIENGNNEAVRKFFEKHKVSKGIGRENKYSLSAIVNEDSIKGNGVFRLKELQVKGKEKFYAYTINKNEKRLSFDEYMEEIGSKVAYDKFECCYGVNIVTGKPKIENMIQHLNTFVGGATGSGKTVFLKFVLYQIMKNPNSEVYILDKQDFTELAGTKKVIFRGFALKTTTTEFFSFINYFWLEQFRRQAIFSKYGCNEYADYVEKVMGKVEGAPIINYSYIIIDEYQTLRNKLTAEIDEREFDDSMDLLLKTVRAAGMCFYIGTQDYQKQKIGEIRESIRNFYLGQMQYCNLLDGDELTNLASNIIGTQLFYHTGTKSFLKIPFTPDYIPKLIEESNDPKNRIKENKIYDDLPTMLNDSLVGVDSDIFSEIDFCYELMGIDRKLKEKLQKTSRYISFSVLVYAITRAFNQGLVNKSTNIYTEIHFEKSADKLLFNNIKFYEKDKKFNELLTTAFENGLDKDLFLETISSVLNNYLRGILGETRIMVLDDVLKKRKEKENENKNNPNLIFDVKFVGDIKPVSVNSMYSIDKEGDVRKTEAASKYENDITNIAVQRMIFKQLKQTREPVYLDIEFAIGVNSRKDGMPSRVGRNDLDNLLKATIDGLKKSIIADDNQVIGIKASVNYVEKRDVTKNNMVYIKVLKKNPDVRSSLIESVQSGGKYGRSFVVDIPTGSAFSIPSVNNMYDVINGKKTLSPNTIRFKAFCSGVAKEKFNEEPASKDMSFVASYEIPNANASDVDNLLKATLDSMKDIVWNDDRQVRSFFVEKAQLKDASSAGKVSLSFHEFVDSLEQIGIAKEDVGTAETGEPVPDSEGVDMASDGNDVMEQDFTQDAEDPISLPSVENASSDAEVDMFVKDIVGEDAPVADVVPETKQEDTLDEETDKQDPSDEDAEEISLGELLNEPEQDAIKPSKKKEKEKDEECDDEEDEDKEEKPKAVKEQPKEKETTVGTLKFTRRPKSSVEEDLEGIL